MITKRYACNPILMPTESNSWELEAAFNGCPIKDGSRYRLLYRALSTPQEIGETKINVSSIGMAISHDGKNWKKREQIIRPEFEWEKYGCEDPRITKIGAKYFVCYTALSQYPFGPEGIKVGLAITRNFKKWEKHPVTPFNAKAMALFPGKISGQLGAVLSVDTDRPPTTKVGLALFKKESDLWSKKFWNNWYKHLDKHLIDIPRNPEDHFEVGAPPIKIKEGWLLVYSYIRNYYNPDKETVFEIQALILDAKNPQKILGYSKNPLMVPEKEYELYGKVPNVIFPTGGFIKGKELHLFYGAADSVCCATTFKIKYLLENIFSPHLSTFSLERCKKNPILEPKEENPWEARSVFNSGAIYEGGRFHLIYRAESHNFISVLGYASSKNGVDFDERSEQPIYLPRKDFEKNDRGQYYGCEDPRLVRIDNKIYMFYTAFNGADKPRVALSSISVKDFLNKKWNWSEPFLISTTDRSNKDACAFPEKFRGKYLIIHRLNDYGMDLLYSKNLTFSEEKLNHETNWIVPRKGKWDGKKVGLNGPPMKTKEGWIILYHGISAVDSHYRIGAILTDLKNPEKIIARTESPILEPIEDYELNGNIPNVVFSCGNVLVKDKIFVYYGGADKVLGVATTTVSKLLKEIKKSAEE